MCLFSTFLIFTREICHIYSRMTLTRIPEHLQVYSYVVSILYKSEKINEDFCLTRHVEYSLHNIGICSIIIFRD